MTRIFATLFPHSLKLRLMAAAGLWIVPVLILAGVLLHLAFLRHLERQIDSDLRAFQRDLLAAARMVDVDNLRLDHQPTDPRFSRPLSGWYWQIALAGRIIRQSESAGPLGPGALGLLSPVDGIVELEGPGERELRILRRQVTLPGGGAPLTILVSAPCDEIDADLQQFSGYILATFASLGAVFLIAVYLQVGFGLRPLTELRRSIASIRSGRRDHLDPMVPSEVEPVVAEVNALIDHNRQLLDRARQEASNLAHTLKNPLSVLAYEISRLDRPQRDMLATQVESITGQVERILKRIRTAGPSRAGQMRVSVGRICDDVVFSLNIIYRERNLAIVTDVEPDLTFAGDPEDLAEILGNLADNACKWANAKVVLKASLMNEFLHIRIDDDGPGIIPAAREAVLGRGLRLDERIPGTGLGLDIVREMVTIYRGKLALTDSDLGGLRVEIDLPAAP